METLDLKRHSFVFPLIFVFFQMLFSSFAVPLLTSLMMLLFVDTLLPIYVNSSTFSRSSHTSDLHIGSLVVACQAPRVIGSVPGLVALVSVFCDEIETLISNVYFSVAARTIVFASCWDDERPINQLINQSTNKLVRSTYRPFGGHLIIIRSTRFN